MNEHARIEMAVRGQHFAVGGMALYCISGIVMRMLGADAAAITQLPGWILASVGTWRMAEALKFGYAARCAWVVSQIVPLVGLFPLAILNSRTTAFLRGSGVKVGVLGAYGYRRPNSSFPLLDALEQSGQRPAVSARLFIAAAISAVIVCLGAAAWWFSIPHTYDDCILENISSAKTNVAVAAVKSSCVSRFPPVFDWERIARNADVLPWSAVRNREEFHSLSKDNQRAAKEDYWQRVLAPAVRSDLRDVAHQKFIADE